MYKMCDHANEHNNDLHVYLKLNCRYNLLVFNQKMISVK